MSPSSNLYRRFAAAASDGIVLSDNDNNRLSWRDIEILTSLLGSVFRSWGLGRGDRLAVSVEKSVPSFLVYLAALRAGVGYVPINTALSAREITVVLENARPSVVVAGPSNAAAQESAAGLGVGPCRVWKSGSLDELIGDATERSEIAATEPDDLAVLIYTSGTTGRPKGAMLSHRNLIANAADLATVWKMSAEDVVLHALPIFHGHGLFVASAVPLIAGARLLMLPRFDVDAVVDTLPDATVMMGVPTFYSRLVAAPRFKQLDLDRVRLFTCGSAPMPGDLATQFAKMTGRRIVERYGTSETGIITSEAVDGDAPAGTVGVALPSAEMRITDSSGAIVSDGEVGSVEVRGPSVFLGYWEDPAATRQAVTDDGWFTTGDLGIVQGGRLRLVGRQKDLIITGGYNVYAKEVEDVLDALPGVAESAVIGVAHPDFGEAVVAVVVPAADVTDDRGLASAVRTEAKRLLSNYKVPKDVFIVDELPRNAMGKVLKTELRDTYKDRFAVAASSQPDPQCGASAPS